MDAAIKQLVESRSVRLLLCAACGIHTVHRRMKDGSYACWCGAVSLPAVNAAEHEEKQVTNGND